MYHDENSLAIKTKEQVIKIEGRARSFRRGNGQQCVVRLPLGPATTELLVCLLRNSTASKVEMELFANCCNWEV